MTVSCSDSVLTRHQVLDLAAATLKQKREWAFEVLPSGQWSVERLEVVLAGCCPVFLQHPSGKKHRENVASEVSRTGFCPEVEVAFEEPGQELETEGDSHQLQKTHWGHDRW